MNKSALKKTAGWLLLAAFAAVLVYLKLQLVAAQSIEIYPDAAPIDDELMFSCAKSILAGNWLGEYNWLTLGKHMFFSVWLAFLSACKIPYLIGGEALYALACAITALAVAPALARKKWAMGAVFAVLWFSPYSWAQFTLRIYRDNIFPSLCLLFFAGVIGFCLRYREKASGGIFYAIIGGLGLGTAWLAREDGVWLLPFGICACAFYVICVLRSKQDKKQTAAHLALPLVTLAACLACTLSYCAMNQKYYGRFIISDFTSTEFEDAVGAMLRCDVNEPQEKVLVDYETRMKIGKAVPLMATLQAELETEPYYKGYGDAAKKEFNSGGLCWAIRKAAYNAGLASDAQSASEFYRTLADDINRACDEGKIECKNARMSTTLMPFAWKFVAPTIAETGNSLRLLFGFEQTSSLAARSYATPEQIIDYVALTYTRPIVDADPATGGVLYKLYAVNAEKTFSAITDVYRVFIYVGTALGLLTLVLWLRKAQTAMCGVMLLGVALSVLLRVGLVSYIEAVSFKVGTYLLYLSSACPLLLLFAALGTAACAVKIAQKLPKLTKKHNI